MAITGTSTTRRRVRCLHHLAHREQAEVRIAVRNGRRPRSHVHRRKSRRATSFAVSRIMVPGATTIRITPQQTHVILWYPSWRFSHPSRDAMLGDVRRHGTAPPRVAPWLRRAGYAASREWHRSAMMSDFPSSCRSMEKVRAQGFQFEKGRISTECIDRADSLRPVGHRRTITHPAWARPSIRTAAGMGGTDQAAQRHHRRPDIRLFPLHRAAAEPEGSAVRAGHQSAGHPRLVLADRIGEIPGAQPAALDGGQRPQAHETIRL